MTVENLWYDRKIMKGLNR